MWVFPADGDATPVCRAELDGCTFARREAGGCVRLLLLPSESPSAFCRTFMRRCSFGGRRWWAISAKQCLMSESSPAADDGHGEEGAFGRPSNNLQLFAAACQMASQEGEGLRGEPPHMLRRAAGAEASGSGGLMRTQRSANLSAQGPSLASGGSAGQRMMAGPRLEAEAAGSVEWMAGDGSAVLSGHAAAPRNAPRYSSGVRMVLPIAMAMAGAAPRASDQALGGGGRPAGPLPSRGELLRQAQAAVVLMGGCPAAVTDGAACHGPEGLPGDDDRRTGTAADAVAADVAEGGDPPTRDTSETIGLSGPVAAPTGNERDQGVTVVADRVSEAGGSGTHRPSERGGGSEELSTVSSAAFSAAGVQARIHAPDAPSLTIRAVADGAEGAEEQGTEPHSNGEEAGCGSVRCRAASSNGVVPAPSEESCCAVCLAPCTALLGLRHGNSVHRCLCIRCASVVLSDRLLFTAPLLLRMQDGMMHHHPPYPSARPSQPILLRRTQVRREADPGSRRI